MTKLKIVRLSPDATIPQYQSEGAAAVDLHAVTGLNLKAGERALVRTGLAMEIPKGSVGLICSRSGMALNQGVVVLNAPGVIDSDYRGEIGVVLANFSDVDYFVQAGSRVAQMMFTSFDQARFKVVETEELSETKRGVGGFGSTGVAQPA